VGTCHEPSIVVGFYRSQLWADSVKQKHAEMEAAKKANDTQKAQELNSWGEARQDLAHQQLKGDAPITNILAALTPAFPEVARQAQVAIIVAELLYAGPMVQTVDVTDLLLDWLRADETTRRIIRDLQNRKGPLPSLH